MSDLAENGGDSPSISTRLEDRGGSLFKMDIGDKSPLFDKDKSSNEPRKSIFIFKCLYPEDLIALRTRSSWLTEDSERFRFGDVNLLYLFFVAVLLLLLFFFVDDDILLLFMLLDDVGVLFIFACLLLLTLLLLSKGLGYVCPRRRVVLRPEDDFGNGGIFGLLL